MFKYSYENLKRVAETKKGKLFLDEIEKDYLKRYDGKIIPCNNYSLIKLYYKEGNRSKFQAQYFDKRVRLNLLQLLSIKDDKYIEPLEEIISAICDEFTWVLPAHNFDSKTQTFDRTKIDLFSAETAFYLSETVYVLGDKLSNDIKNRVRLCVEDKIVKNFESSVYFWESVTSNWASVCGLGIGLSYLYLFPERYDIVKDRIEKYFQNYLSGIDEEGYCYEGLGYWGYGFSFFTLFYDVYVQLKDRPAFLDTQKLYNLSNYPMNVQMDEGVYVPFADGGRRYLDINAYLPCFYAIKSLYGDKVDCPINVETKFCCLSEKAFGFRYLLATEITNDFKFISSKEKLTYFKKAEVMIYKNKNYSFAVKSGNNNEEHNHNDIGAFQIVKNGKRLIVDIGPAEYTKNFFDPAERYKEDIFVCGSMSHSVPIIDGKFQHQGEKFYGTVLGVGNNFFEVDLTKAYEEGDHFIKARYDLKENGVLVKYTFSGINKNIVFRFVSEHRPTFIDDKVFIDEMKISENSKGKPTISIKEYSPQNRTAFVNHNGKCEAFVIDYEINNNYGENEFFFEF